MISAIKKEMPEVMFCGAVPAQTLARIEFNPITGHVYSQNETWAMAFDPQKWGIINKGKPVSKEEFQRWFYGRHPYGGKLKGDYDWRKAGAFFPDITNADYQELLVSWAKKQITCGADAIWIDGLPQEPIFNAIFKDAGGSIYKDLSYAAAKIVDDIHSYGVSIGRYIYVGYWANSLGLVKGSFYIPGKVDTFTPPLAGFSINPERSRRIDFVTVSPSKEEVRAKKLDEDKWGKEVESIHKIYGDIPIFAFIDWTFDDSQVVAFSQKLNKEEQLEVLETFDKAFEKMGVKFVYPIHGGYMGSGAVTTNFSFGKDRIYDSLAPEFETYETIKKLAQQKVRLKQEVGGNNE